MSTPQNEKFNTRHFAKRLIQLCGTNKPAKVARYLGISYQASKNYLEGRLPDTQTLLQISERTDCSIDWLLKGEEKSFATKKSNLNTHLSIRELKLLIRSESKKVFTEMSANQIETVQEKVLVVRQEDIKEEKVLDEEIPSSKSSLKSN